MTTLHSLDKPSLPSFIRKIFQILSTPEYSHIICWDKDGKSIKIFDFKDLEQEVLEVEFKHRNHRSFIRQLNMYGFKKMRKSTSTTIYFFHPLFTRDGQNNLHLIERKRENKRCLKLDLLCQSIGDESKDEEFRKMKKRRAVLKFLGMEKPISGEGSEGSDRISNSNSSSAVLSVEEKFLNPTNAIKQRKTSINVAPVDPFKNSSKLEELSKRSFDIPTNSTLRREDSTAFDAGSLKSEISSTQTKPRGQSQNRGFSTFQIPSVPEASPFTTTPDQMVSPVSMFPYSPFSPYMYQPQFSMYPHPFFLAQPSQLQCFGFPQ